MSDTERTAAEGTAQAGDLHTLQPGCTVVLSEVPPDFVESLDAEDQAAIEAVVGQPLQFNGYDERGYAELEFVDQNGATHSIWVPPSYLA